MLFLVKDGDTQKVIELINENASTGEVGDGKIFVTAVTAAVRVRTGEKDEAAL